jgi:hypothetical protein
MTNEEYVRSVWDRVLVCDGSYRHYAKGTLLLNWANHCFYEFEDWSAAAEFTRELLEQIQHVETEIGWLRHTCPGPSQIRCRVISREQTALDELKKGMK